MKEGKKILRKLRCSSQQGQESDAFKAQAKANAGDSIQLSPEGEVNSGGYILRREASRYISTALHRPSDG